MQYLTAIKNYLVGKKSYVLSVLLALYVCLQAFNVVATTPDQDIAVYGLFGALFGVTLSAKVNRLKK